MPRSFRRVDRQSVPAYLFSRTPPFSEVAMGRSVRLAGVLSCVLVAGSLQGQTPAVRTLKIAMIAKSSANFLFLAARKGAEDAAAALSANQAVGIEVLWLTPAREDVAQQVEYV